MKLTEYLRDKKSDFIRSRAVMVEGYSDPTYGLQEPRSEYIDLVDFDALMDAIDSFSLEFKK